MLFNFIYNTIITVQYYICKQKQKIIHIIRYLLYNKMISINVI